jgi:hypothetical protein
MVLAKAILALAVGVLSLRYAEHEREIYGAEALHDQ